MDHTQNLYMSSHEAQIAILKLSAVRYFMQKSVFLNVDVGGRLTCSKSLNTMAIGSPEESSSCQIILKIFVIKTDSIIYNQNNELNNH